MGETTEISVIDRAQAMRLYAHAKHRGYELDEAIALLDAGKPRVNWATVFVLAFGTACWAGLIVLARCVA